MADSNHGSIEFLKFPNPQYPGDRTKLIKKWLRDSWARKKIVALQQAVSSIVVPTKTSQLQNDSGYITSADVPPGSTASSTTPLMDGTAAVGTENAFARGDHRHPTDTSRQAALSTAQMAAVNSGVTAAKVAAWDGIEVPTKTSELTNDSGYVTSAAIPTETSDLVNDSGFITAADIPAIPSKTSQLTNDSGFITSAPVTNVNGQTGAVSLDAADVGAQDALTSAQLAAVNSGITADNLAVNDSSVLCTVTPIEPTLSAGANYATYGGCWYYKIGHRVTVHIGVSGLTTGEDTMLWTLPAGYRPRSSIGWVGNAGGIGSYGRFRITSAGVVRAYSAAQYALGEISFDAFS